LDSISPRSPSYRRRRRRTNWWRTKSRRWSPFVVNQFLSSSVVKSSSSTIHTTKVTSLCHITINLERIIPVVRSSRQHRWGIHDFLLHPSLCVDLGDGDVSGEGHNRHWIFCHGLEESSDLETMCQHRLQRELVTFYVFEKQAMAASVTIECIEVASNILPHESWESHMVSLDSAVRRG
jgi:hypothetical protein